MVVGSAQIDGYRAVRLDPNAVTGSQIRFASSYCSLALDGCDSLLAENAALPSSLTMVSWTCRLHPVTQTHGMNAPPPEPIRLRSWQRGASAIVGAVGAGAGSVATFTTTNQAGSIALLLVGGLGLLMALIGRVPDRIGREGVVFEPVPEAVVDALVSFYENEDVPLSAKAEARDILGADLDSDQRAPSPTSAHVPRSEVGSETQTWTSSSSSERRSLQLRADSSLLRYAAQQALQTVRLPPNMRVMLDVPEQTLSAGGTPIQVRLDAIVGEPNAGRPSQIAVEILTPLKRSRSLNQRVANLLRAGFGSVVLIGTMQESKAPLPSQVHLVTVPDELPTSDDLTALLEGKLQTLLEQLNTARESAS